MTQVPSHPSEPTARARVLLVEDNQAASKGLARLLETQGFEVTTAVDGASALGVLRSGKTLDFLLTDMQLPDIDGRDLARQAAQLVPSLRIGLITGWDLELTPDDPSSPAIDWVMTKPVNLDDLLAKLRTSLPAGPPRGGGADPSAPEASEA
jgi:DNA-binding response OmpR family regulator